MSPNEQKVTPGREAMAWARSIISSEVTHTGQPGPWTSSTSGGRTRSMPYLTMVCVWPPQTSMRVHDRVAARAMAAASCRAAAASRYSSTYFMATAPHRSRPSPLGGEGRIDLQLIQLVHLRQKREDAPRLLFVDPRKSKTD